MRQGTTPTLKITLNNLDLSLMKSIQVIFKQKDVTLVKNIDGLEIQGQVLKCTLSQEETLNFNEGKCSVQVRALAEDGTAIASSIRTINMYSVLNREVIA